MGPPGAASGAVADHGYRDPRGDPAARAAFGYWRCAAEGNDVILFGEDGRREATRFAFPRQNKEGGLCIADFFRDVDDDERDVIGFRW